jgi:hypothetical protein
MENSNKLLSNSILVSNQLIANSINGFTKLVASVLSFLKEKITPTYHIQIISSSTRLRPRMLSHPAQPYHQAEDKQGGGRVDSAESWADAEHGKRGFSLYYGAILRMQLRPYLKHFYV